MRKILLLTVLLLLYSVVLISKEKPNIVFPFGTENIIPAKNISGNEKLASVSSTSTTALDAIVTGADRLIEKQYTDGSWGWPLNAPPTYANILGPITMGLAKAYLRTISPTQKAGLQLAGTYLLGKTNNFSPSDGYLAKQLDLIFNVTTYTDHLITNFYNPLAAGTYNRNGAGTLYNTASYITLIRTNRSGDQANLAAWDLGMGLVGASMCGASTSEWIAGVKAEIDELDPDISYYDVIGLAGAIYGLAFVGEDFDPTAGEHASANNLSDLADILATYQLSTGGFTWSANYIIENDNNETIQETAYAILALNEVNRTAHLLEIQKAASYIISMQLPTGGFENAVGDGENNEVSGEAIWGVTVAAFNIYLSSSTSASAGIVYPNDSWGTTPYEPPFVDWDFTAPINFYIVPEVATQFGACNIVIEWDNTIYGYIGIDKTGGIFDGTALWNSPQFFTLGQISGVIIDASSMDNTNYTISSGQYIAKLELNLLKPGYAPINFTVLYFRKFDCVGGNNNVNFLGNSGMVKSYLGDVATPPSDQTTGDGLVNGTDLAYWSQSYWSGVPGFVHGMTYYKVKYDIGPTTTNTVYGLPVPDGKIQFEDLVIFAMSYGLSGNGVYPKVKPVPETPIELSFGQPLISGSQTILPIWINGTVQDLRAASLVLSGKFEKFLGVEKGELLSSYSTPVLTLGRSQENNIFVDVSLVGADITGINQNGVLVLLRFEGETNLNFASANVRNTANIPMLVKLNSKSKQIPMDFGISQNYPNPFNPSTLIQYQIPLQSVVQIDVFNVVGEKVATLVNDLKEPGYYDVTWDASSMTSGVYFVRINSNYFTATKKMLLMK